MFHIKYQKFFEDLSKFSLFCPLLGPKRGQPVYKSPSPKHVSTKLAGNDAVVLEKKSFNGKR